MPYWIEVRGFAVRCDTAKELKEALEEFGGESGPKILRRKKKSREQAEREKPSESPYVSLVKGLKKPIRQFVKVLSDAPAGVTNEQLVSALGLRTKKSLGNIIGILIRRGRTLGLKPSDVLTVRRERVDGKRIATYKLSADFSSVASGELGKPGQAKTGGKFVQRTFFDEK